MTMGTRSAILRVSEECDGVPRGRYCHWDGYPAGVGATLFDLIRNRFEGDVEAAIKLLIDDHPAGWSSICGVDWDQQPGFIEHSTCDVCGKAEDKHKKYRKVPASRRRGPDEREVVSETVLGHTYTYDYGKKRRPLCYCHGDRREERHDLLLTEASSVGCEYAYVISPERRVMYVLSSYSGDGTKMIGMFGMGDEDATWKLLAEVDLDGDEPDWSKLEGG
jgi:hypothetical protein